MEKFALLTFDDFTCILKRQNYFNRTIEYKKDMFKYLAFALANNYEQSNHEYNFKNSAEENYNDWLNSKPYIETALIDDVIVFKVTYA